MRRIAPVGVIFGGLLLLLAAAPGQAEEIEVREVALRRVDEGLSLDVDFGFELTPRLADADYDAAVRMRLDTALLPKPFQLSALTGRDLQLESAWKRFIVRPRS